MDDIHAIVEQINVQVQHIFREANQLADYVANTAINKEAKQVFFNFNQLPSRGRKLLNIDKHKIPLVRIKTRRINIDNNGQHA
ncbi:hypothetical protein R3W88_012384 [Solanum pinnatisectum]|uniref:RNase H type-1 domain-containing protein n=1 Tax=Solanum pinnatisectum TaxID=50273 RepID=A0AAV9L8V6_9SOLN|nr:hypothetical protein R3W88_012384 [Solanum pinnatisectum]